MLLTIQYFENGEKALIPPEVIGNILDRVSIIEVIGKYTEIKKSGRNYLALCPFHQEKTPSFSISEEKRLYHCFGCGASGNTLHFLMEYRKLGFIEALQELAKMAAIDLSSYSDEKDYRAAGEKDILLKINKESMLHFHKSLMESPEAKGARDYLNKRKLTEETIKEFRIGFGGSSWNSLAAFLKGKGYGDELIIKSGVACQGNDGLFDRFKGRVIFPIFDRDGNTVGFGGRILSDDKSQAKYLNSPESPVFHKGGLLFALNFARDEIIKKKEALIVEGYMDVIALHQHGIRNAVAPLGTALTENQLTILKRYADGVVFVFDGDDAGITAANRALDVAGDSQLSQTVVILPGKQDPYDYAMEKGRDAFLKYTGSKRLLPIDFKIRYFARKIDARKNKVKFVLSIFPYIKRVKSSITREEYLKKTGEFINENYSIILSEYQNFMRSDKNTGSVLNNSSLKTPADSLEAELVGMLLIKPETVSELSEILKDNMFSNSEAKRVFSSIRDYPDGAVNTGELIASLEKGEIFNRVSQYAQAEFNSAALKETAYRLKAHYLNREISNLSRIIAKFQGESKLSEVQKYNKMQEDLKMESFAVNEKIEDCAREKELSE